jgi:predicted transcriptional regulator
LESFDRRLILILRRKGGQTIESLAELTGVDWERVFFSVDRLSRMGKVMLNVVRPCEYRVSVAGRAH